MNVPIIRYPKCGGGHWLGNLVWQLQNSYWTVPADLVVFDELPQGSINLNHWFETQQDGSPVFYSPDYKENKLFSTNCKFNMYLNLCIKSRYDYYHIEKLSRAEQVFDLSDTAIFVMTNKYFDQYYCHNIDLDYAWIFQDPDRFIGWLYDFMTEYNIPFNDNQAHIYANIDKYKISCANPKDIIDNLESPIWLGWCHAVSLLENILLSGQVALQPDLKSLAAVLEPACIPASKLAKQHSFNWTYEHTTR